MYKYTVTKVLYGTERKEYILGKDELIICYEAWMFESEVIGRVKLTQVILRMFSLLFC